MTTHRKSKNEKNDLDLDHDLCTCHFIMQTLSGAEALSNYRLGRDILDTF
jgi:hypothetical protein